MPDVLTDEQRARRRETDADAPDWRPLQPDEMSDVTLIQAYREVKNADPQDHADAERFAQEEEIYLTEMEKRGYTEEAYVVEWEKDGETIHQIDDPGLHRKWQRQCYEEEAKRLDGALEAHLDDMRAKADHMSPTGPNRSSDKSGHYSIPDEDPPVDTEPESIDTTRTCEVILKHRKVSYTRHLEGLSGTWTERKKVFEGTFVECWNYIQDCGPTPTEISYEIKNEPPKQGPKKPPRDLEKDELPF